MTRETDSTGAMAAAWFGTTGAEKAVEAIFGTKFPAVFTMHTPSGATDCCVRHARMAERIFRAMGFHTNATKAAEGAECANCVNEAELGPNVGAKRAAEGGPA